MRFPYKYLNLTGRVITVRFKFELKGALASWTVQIWSLFLFSLIFKDQRGQRRPENKKARLCRNGDDREREGRVRESGPIWYPCEFSDFFLSSSFPLSLFLCISRFFLRIHSQRYPKVVGKQSTVLFLAFWYFLLIGGERKEFSFQRKRDSWKSK